MSQHTDTADAQRGAFRFEHSAAYAMALAALILGAIGLLRGFGIIGTEATDVGEPGTQAAGFGALWDSTVWFLGAFSLGFLSWALHQTDHHRMRNPEHAPDADEGAWKGEHLFAYLMALATVATTVLGLLVSFDVLGRGNDQPDGLPWLLASVLYGIVTNTLHTVRHHQLATEDDIVRIVDARMSRSGSTARPVGEYSSETTR